ncbi:MAG TPA: asparagine synthase (glutamine-hydrolyzing) [Terriglobales bacterium]|nr:asparagine synthase (glutamine-hydrolyzing) [Terriglobales bacterium]
MCGICGKVNFDRQSPVPRELLVAMMATISHRGPDQDGMYLAENVGLGHKRLSIIDLSSGAQPMCNEDESVWIVFNGEIYNYKEFRQQLLAVGHTFRTASDTEVIIHAYEEFGQEFLSRLQGMFTFALWDSRRNLLLLARDRVGIKPLYYSVIGDSLLFGSEIKAMLVDDAMRPEMDPEALDSFLTFGYVPGEQTLFRNVRKLPPGHYLTVSRGVVTIKQYWDLDVAGPKRTGSVEENVEALRALLRQSIRDHMISDVPVGVLLSGGVDSAAVLSYAVETAGDRISTFTIGFGEGCPADEREPARLVARQFGTDHYETTITSRDFADWLPSFVWHLEEPVCEPPAIALFFVSKLARRHVTVLLSGEGGDEAFAGYNTYRNIVWLERIKRCLGPLATPLSALAGTLVSGQCQRYAELLDVPLETYYYSRSSDPFAYFNRHRAGLYSRDFSASLSGNRRPLVSESLLRSVPASDTLSKLLYVDTKTWLPDDLLVKADKVTMANSVELRVPLLDYHVLEFAASLPSSQKLRGFEPKYLLRRAIRGRVSPAILQRRKTGFPVPYESWLRSELKAFALDLLTDPKTVSRGYFDSHAVEQLLLRNSPEQNYSKEIFSLLILELWHRGFMDRSPVKLDPVVAASA